MNHDAARYKAERDLARQSTQHHIRREREIETILAHLIATAQEKPRCHCRTVKAIKALASELKAPERERRAPGQ